MGSVRRAMQQKWVHLNVHGYEKQFFFFLV